MESGLWSRLKGHHIGYAKELSEYTAQMFCLLALLSYKKPL
jgi:hypothetical protein